MASWRKAQARCRRHSRFSLAAAAVVFLAVFALPAVARAYDTSGAPQAISALNQQRAANGIPPIGLDQSTLKSSCTIDNHEIASTESDWSASQSPWDDAPFHQSILYNPAHSSGSYAVYGPSESSFPGGAGSWSCMWFTTDWTASSPTGNPTFYSFTSDQGPSQVAAAERVVAESPASPAQVLGLPADATTGPNLLVYALGIGSAPHIVSAGLTGPGGAVAVKTIDGTTPFNGGTIMFPWTGDVVVMNPLHGATTYTATVEWQGGDPLCGSVGMNFCGQTYTQSFSFTTVALDNSLDLENDIDNTGAILVTVTSDAPNPTLTLASKAKTTTVPLQAEKGHYTARLRGFTPGTYRACASSGGGASGYQLAQSCQRVTVPTFKQLLALGIGQRNVVRRSQWRWEAVYIGGTLRGPITIAVRQGHRVLAKRAARLGVNGLAMSLRRITHGKVLARGRYLLSVTWHGRTATQRFRVV